ncbi:FkbM family methyltransferase [Plantactinospora sp. CA-290183]|uniref:FkbM family methyltransferase n=1 Tax=Plantactinospora sp. CA-290183 TaxID=3240006 RepID=UPI003D92804E
MTGDEPPPDLATTIVTLDNGVRMHTVSALDARFLSREIFDFDGYGDLDLPEAPFVVDAGANIGMFMLKVKMSRKSATILAFEPMPALAETVRRNIELHSYEDVTLHQVALGEEPREGAEFTYYPLLPSSSTRYPAIQENLRVSMERTFPSRVLDRMYKGHKVTVDIVRLSDYLPDDRRIDLMKVDTSGSELEVLSGIDARHWPLIQRMILDVHDRDGRVAAVSEALRQRGMQVRVRPAPMAEGDGLNFLIHAEREGA